VKDCHKTPYPDGEPALSEPKGHEKERKPHARKLDMTKIPLIFPFDETTSKWPVGNLLGHLKLFVGPGVEKVQTHLGLFLFDGL